MNPVRIVASRNLEIFPAGRAASDEHSVKSLLKQITHAVHGRVVANIDAHVEDRVDLLHEDSFRKPESRDIRPHESAGLIELVDNCDLVPEREQVVGYSKRSRTGAHARDTPAVFLFWNLRKQMLDFAAKICRYTL